MSRDTAIRFEREDLVTGDIVEVELPGKYEVCPVCEGRGTHVNPSIDGNGLSREDFDEDPDFAEGYFSGRYDVRCQECDGRNVVLVVDEAEVKRLGLEKDLRAYYEYRRNLSESEAISRAERRMGA